MKELQYLNKYFIKYKYRFLSGLFITIVAQVFSLFTPELIGNSIQVIEEFVKKSRMLFRTDTRVRVSPTSRTSKYRMGSDIKWRNSLAPRIISILFVV